MPIIIQPETYDNMLSLLTEDEVIRVICTPEFRGDTLTLHRLMREKFKSKRIRKELDLLTDEAFRAGKLTAQHAFCWAMCAACDSHSSSREKWEFFMDTYWNILSEEQQTIIKRKSGGIVTLVRWGKMSPKDLEMARLNQIHSIEDWKTILLTQRYDSLKGSYKVLRGVLNNCKWLYKKDTPTAQFLIEWFKFSDDLAVMKILIEDVYTYATELWKLLPVMVKSSLFKHLIEEHCKYISEKCNFRYQNIKQEIAEALSRNLFQFSLEERKEFLKLCDDLNITLDNSIRMMLCV